MFSLRPKHLQEFFETSQRTLGTGLPLKNSPSPTPLPPPHFCTWDCRHGSIHVEPVPNHFIPPDFGRMDRNHTEPGGSVRFGWVFRKNLRTGPAGRRSGSVRPVPGEPCSSIFAFERLVPCRLIAYMMRWDFFFLSFYLCI